MGAVSTVSVLNDLSLGFEGVGEKTNQSTVRHTLVGEADLQSAANIFLSSIESIEARQKKQLPNDLHEFCPTDPFPVHTIYIISNHFEYCSLYEMGKALHRYQHAQKSGERCSMQLSRTSCSLQAVKECACR